MGERVDFEALYETEFASVFGVVYLLARDRTIAEEACQEAFTRALERWERLRGQPWTRGWVMKTALNLVRRELRWKTRRLADEPPALPERDVEAAIDLWRQIRRLSRRRQQVLVLHCVFEMPIRDVAQAIGCAEWTVRAHLFKARAALSEAARGVAP